MANQAFQGMSAKKVIETVLIELSGLCGLNQSVDCSITLQMKV